MILPDVESFYDPESVNRVRLFHSLLVLHKLAVFLKCLGSCM